MNTKQKADNLIKKFITEETTIYQARQLALICVNEIIEAVEQINYGLEYLLFRDYYLSVKQHILNLNHFPTNEN